MDVFIMIITSYVSGEQVWNSGKKSSYTNITFIYLSTLEAGFCSHLHIYQRQRGRTGHLGGINNGRALY
ncbi:unnamed protein product [Tenebrio molitor]|nr:unnamed protein product [Tenebrio molitor]